MRSVQASVRRLSLTRMNTRSSSSSTAAARAPTLPRLPVPDLRKTLDKYLTSLEPFLLDETERSGQSFSEAYQLRKKWAEDFYTGIGSQLQERLIALDKSSPNNWLEDNFWTKVVYLQSRAPLLINSNWWVALYDDVLGGEPPPRWVDWCHDNKFKIPLRSLRRSAWMIHRILEFKDRLDTRELHPETTRTGIWLRESVSKMFNTARIPAPHCDTLSERPSESYSLHARSILVMLHNFCYTVPVYSPKGELSPPQEIYLRLRNLAMDVSNRLQAGEEAFPIGVLSSGNRDFWAKNLQHLLSLSPLNRTSYDAMVTSIMGLSLDHDRYLIPQSVLERHPREFHNSDHHLHMIRGTADNFTNRFYDKPFTLIMSPTGQAGMTGDHSPCDALVPSIVAEYSVAVGIDDDVFEKVESLPISKEGFTRLEWEVDQCLWAACKEARQLGLEMIEDSDDSVLDFRDYAGDWIKTVAKFSPDAYIQMALQLAWYRTRGEFTATYETVLTRMFKKGRTETLRSYTKDSRAWILAMVDPHSNAQSRHQLLTRAIQTHTRLTREAATGRGIDRHLLGLQLLLKPTDPIPVLFTDLLFMKSQEWKLSTSGLSAGYWFLGTGFGAPYQDGYGINYLAGPDVIKFGIESKFSSSKTSTYIFKNALVSAFQDMRYICLTGTMLSEEVVLKSQL